MEITDDEIRRFKAFYFKVCRIVCIEPEKRVELDLSTVPEMEGVEGWQFSDDDLLFLQLVTGSNGFDATINTISRDGIVVWHETANSWFAHPENTAESLKVEKLLGVSLLRNAEVERFDGGAGPPQHTATDIPDLTYHNVSSGSFESFSGNEWIEANEPSSPTVYTRHYRGGLNCLVSEPVTPG